MTKLLTTPQMAEYLRMYELAFRKLLKTDYRDMPKQEIRNGKTVQYFFDKDLVMDWIQETFN